MMSKSRLAGLALAVVAGLTACSDPAPQAPVVPMVAPEPAPAPAPPPTPPPAPQEDSGPPMEYGDDRTLDRLWDRCSDGDYDSCDQLFWDSPADSDYESFALAEMERIDSAVSPGGGLGSDEVMTDLALDIVWAGMSRAERNQLCDGVDLFGVEAAAAIIVGDSRDLLLSAVEDWLDETCP